MVIKQDREPSTRGAPAGAAATHDTGAVPSSGANAKEHVEMPTVSLMNETETEMATNPLSVVKALGNTLAANTNGATVATCVKVEFACTALEKLSFVMLLDPPTMGAQVRMARLHTPRGA
jgi:hypothetical protein